MKYKVIVPTTYFMSRIDYIVNDDSRSETKEEQALWNYNSSREHDQLPPLDELPKGTVFLPLHKLDVD